MSAIGATVGASWCPRGAQMRMSSTNCQLPTANYHPFTGLTHGARRKKKEERRQFCTRVLRRWFCGNKQTVANWAHPCSLREMLEGKEQATHNLFRAMACLAQTTSVFSRTCVHIRSMMHAWIICIHMCSYIHIFACACLYVNIHGFASHPLCQQGRP